MDVLEKLIKERKENDKERDRIGNELEAYFKPEVDRLLSLKKFQDTKEYLRAMPDCVEKVLFFRQIIILENEEKENEIC